VCYRNGGARELGTLVTLEATNNFPRHAVREDGPYLVWLGLGRERRRVDDPVRPAVRTAFAPPFATGLLRRPPEEIVLDPSARSRLRWL
jgi:hypothetical protein